MDEIKQLKERIANLEKENLTLYAAILEAASLGNNAALRCKVELQRIARADAKSEDGASHDSRCRAGLASGDAGAGGKEK